MKNSFKKKIIITGANGFIGSQISKEIEKHRKFGVYKLSRFYCDSKNFFRCGKYYDDIPSEILKNAYCMIHLAGISHENKSISQNKYFRANEELTENLMKVAVKNGVKRVIFFSSIKATNAEKNKNYGYGNSKLNAEKKIQKILKNTSTSFDIIRCSAVYGVGSKGFLSLMCKIIKLGIFPPISNIENKRSLVHISDVKSMIVHLINLEAKNRIINFSDGKKYSSSQIYEQLCFACGKKPSIFRIPNFIIKYILFLIPNGTLISNKLFGNEYNIDNTYKTIGFKCNKTLKNYFDNS